MKHVFVISDLHLGNASAFEMSDTALVQSFFSWVRDFASATSDTVEVVVNGDGFDFTIPTADHSSVWTPDGSLAVDSMVDSSRTLTAGYRLFATSCREFLAASPRASVVILLGNHDLELMHHAVRELLISAVDGSRRLRFVLDGGMRVGTNGWIEHGNRFDPQNRVDYHSFARCVRAGTTVTLPIGHRILETVVNPLKRRFWWIDLIDPLPSVEFVLPLLDNAMDRLWKELQFVFSIPARDILSGAGLRAIDEEEWRRLHHFVTTLVEGLSGAGRSRSSSTRLLELESSLVATISQRELNDLEMEQEAILDGVRDIASMMPVDVVVMGHTHSAKRLAVTTPSRIVWYYNTGSWCRMIRIGSATASAKAGAERPFAALLDALWQGDVEPYMMGRACCAHLMVDKDRITHHELLWFTREEPPPIRK